MAEALPLSEGELALLAALLRHRVRFMVVGLSAAALQGAPVVTEDVDLWFESLSDPELADALKEVDAAYVPPFAINPPMLAGRHSEPFDVVIRMDGLGTFDEEFANSVKIRLGRIEVNVLPLDRILESKLAADRPKDRLVVPVLRNALLAIQAKARTRVPRTSKKSKRHRRRN